MKITKKRRVHMRNAALKAVFGWWHYATHPSATLIAFANDYPEDVDPEDQNVFSLFREIGLGVVWKSLSYYRRRHHQPLMPIKPRGKFYHPDFYEDLPDGVFDDTSSGINMEGLCNFADEEDESPDLQRILDFFGDLALAERESDGPFDVTMQILQQHGFRPGSPGDLSGLEAFEFHQNTNYLELPFEIYQDFQCLARDSYDVEEGFTEEEIEQEIRECDPKTWMQETESSPALGNEATAPARAATTNAAGGFDFGCPPPLAESDSLSPTTTLNQ